MSSYILVDAERMDEAPRYFLDTQRQIDGNPISQDWRVFVDIRYGNVSSYR